MRRLCLLVLLAGCAVPNGTAPLDPAEIPPAVREAGKIEVHLGGCILEFPPETRPVVIARTMSVYTPIPTRARPHA